MKESYKKYTSVSQRHLEYMINKYCTCIHSLPKHTTAYCGLLKKWQLEKCFPPSLLSFFFYVCCPVKQLAVHMLFVDSGDRTGWKETMRVRSNLGGMT